MGWNYSSLISIKQIDNIEAYLVHDKPAYKPSTSIRYNILLRNNSDNEERVNVKVIGYDDKVVYEEKIILKPKEFKIVSNSGDTPSNCGVYRSKLLINDKLVDETEYLVDDPSRRDPLYFTIVWHNHQAPNYLPDGRIHSPWAYIYVWRDILKPYGLGPYHYHSIMLKKHPHYKSTYNLSPSLLKQWIIALSRGVEFTSGEKYDPSHEYIGIIRETLNNYREALHSGRIDVLTSIYAHTIAGFLTDVLGAIDIVREEIEYGIKITREAMGDDYVPQGIWTPEMAFSMSLIPIYHDLGIKYTVLDDINHFLKAEGDKDSQYEPYIVIDTSSKKYITVFFRDQELSDILGFKNNFYSEPHAWRNAYELTYKVVSKWLLKDSKTLVLALDGENWMTFSKNPPLTAYFLDKMIIYLETLDDNKFIKLSTLREMYDKIPAKRILTHIPTNSWLGTFRKWRGERHEHEQYWVKTYATYRKLLAYEKIISSRDEYSNKARWALWHALDSDYWWAEFWHPQIIDTWLNEANKILDERLRLISVKHIHLVDRMVEDEESGVAVTIDNRLDKEIYASITLGGPGIVVINDELKPVKVKPRSSYTRIIRLKPKYTGKGYIIASIISNGYVIDSKYLEVEVNPALPPNPR